MINKANLFRNISQVVLLLMLILSATRLGAQTGSMAGRITDPSGAAIPGATITVTGAAGQIKAATSGVDGRYTINGLQPGTYTLRATAQGFALFEKTEVQVASGPVQTLDVRLRLEVAKENITVSDVGRVDVDPSSNVGAIVLKTEDLDSLSDNPEDLEEDLQALAGPSVGPNGGQIYVDGFSGASLPPKSSIREIRINQNPFSAEFDRLGFGRIEILTKPGSDKFHGQIFFNFGDSALNSRNPFAAEKPSYQSKMFDVSLGGPLTKKSSYFLDYSRRAQDETSVTNALILDDAFNTVSYTNTLVNPQKNSHFNGRYDYQLSPNHTLVARYSFMSRETDNEGVDEFSLPSRAYDSTSKFHTIQATETSVWNTHAVTETRFQFTRQRSEQSVLGNTVAITVPEAFTSGSASVGNSYSTANGFELYNSTSLNLGKHMVKIGGRLKGGSDTDYSLSNYNGRYTFDSLAAYRTTLLGLQNGWSSATIRALGGGASQFSINGGEPLADISQVDAGLFVQDDWRLRPNFSINLGLRYEDQSNISDHKDLAPRVGFAWGLGGKQSRTVLRGGAGIFYDRVDESLTLAERRQNGINQLQYVVINPDFYPTVPSVSQLASWLVPSAVRVLDDGIRSPYVMQSVLSLERQLPKNISASVTYAYSRGLRVLRSRNINAPLTGTYDAADPSSAVYPYGDVGDMYLYEASGMFKQSQLITNLSARVGPKLRLFGFYMLGKAESNADGSSGFPANQYDLSGEWGRASFDTRHRMFIGGSISAPLGVQMSPFITASSGRPFNITIGKDLNGDSVYNDRPAFATDLTRSSVVRTAYGDFDTNPIAGQTIIPRNYAEGPGQFSVNLRVSRTFGFGTIAKSATDATQEGGPGGPPPMGGVGGPRGGPGGGGMRGGGGPGGGGPGGGGPGGMFGGGSTGKRFNLTLSVSARNLLNNVNLANPVGNLSSSLFGTSNAISSGMGGGGSATANRRIEFQARLSF
ncbi:MAG: carboxypeptidase regulatory-like domain-containing protein [Bryobacteraceae bacterium]